MRFSDLQDNFIINKWKEIVLNNSMSINVVILFNILNKITESITEIQIQTKIKYLKKKYREASIYNIGII